MPFGSLVMVALVLLAGPAGGIAVQWRGGEVADETLAIAVREALAGVDGRPIAAVPDRALDRARVAVSREHPVAIRELASELRRGLDAADTAYREGRFVDAQATLADAIASVRAHPELPGAAASAREAQLLAARIAWARGESAVAEQALADALRLDPGATLAARRAPPELVDRYRALQVELLATRDHDWLMPVIVAEPDDPSIVIEIDGVLGLRSVPPGPHFVVVYRDGHPPIADWRELDTPWTVRHASARIGTDPDVEQQAICDALALELLVVAERRGTDVGLQGYRCGVGWGPRWSGKRERLTVGATTIMAGPFDRPATSLTDTWLAPENPAIAVTTQPDPLPRPWYRRGWIWGTSAGVGAAIVAGVVTGVVLSNRRASDGSLEIDADQFIGADNF